jgi:hypothetical protein
MRQRQEQQLALRLALVVLVALGNLEQLQPAIPEALAQLLLLAHLLLLLVVTEAPVVPQPVELEVR